MRSLPPSVTSLLWLNGVSMFLRPAGRGLGDASGLLRRALPLRGGDSVSDLSSLS